MRGSTFLKVMGILGIVFGGIALVAMLATFQVTSSLLGLASQIGLSTGVVKASIAMSFVAPIVMLISGILGVANSKKPEKAGINVVFGLLMLIIAIINIVLGSKLSGISPINLISLVIPVLYLIASFMLKSNNNSGYSAQ